MLVALLLAVAQTPPPPVAVPPGAVARGALVIHIVDAEGDLVIEDFVIRVTPQPSTATNGRRSRGNGAIDREEGSATFDSLKPGRYVVEAIHRTGDAAEPVEVEVRARERFSCELRLATPPPSRCLYVVVGEPEHVEGLQLVARAASGEAIPLALAKDATNRYVARGVPPGRYTVSVVDPRFRATSIEDVLPGEVAQLTLSGTGSLVLRFRALPGGAPLRPHALELASATWSLLREPIRVEASLVVLEDLLPGNLLVAAHFVERAPVLIRVNDLRHGERRELDVDVPLGHSVTGRVVDAAGEPVAGVVVRTHATIGEFAQVPYWWCVWLEPRLPDQANQANFEFTNARATRRSARTDSEGRYTFSGLAPGLHRVRAFGTPFTRREVETFVGAEHNLHTAPDIALVGSASADVDVRLPVGLDPKELEFVFQFGSSSWLKPSEEESSPVLDARGQIVLRGLPEETCTLVVSRRVVGSSGPDVHLPLARVTFVPKRGAPTPVILDARQQ